MAIAFEDADFGNVDCPTVHGARGLCSRGTKVRQQFLGIRARAGPIRDSDGGPVALLNEDPFPAVAMLDDKCLRVQVQGMGT